MSRAELEALFAVPPPCRIGRPLLARPVPAWRRIVALLEHDPGRTWRLVRIAAELGLTYDFAAVKLHELCRGGRVQRVGLGVYQAAQPAHWTHPGEIR